MAISYVAGTTAAGADDLTINTPSGVQADDVLIALVATHNGATVTTPSGWTQISTGSVSWQGSRYTLLRRTAGSSEPSSVTFVTEFTYTAGLIRAYRGVDTTTPIHGTTVSADNAYDPAILTAAITTSAATTLIMAAVTHDGGSSDVISTPSGMGNALGYAGGTPLGLASFDEALASAGTYDRDTTNSTSRTSVGLLVALTPAAAAGARAPLPGLPRMPLAILAQ